MRRLVVLGALALVACGAPPDARARTAGLPAPAGLDTNPPVPAVAAPTPDAWTVTSDTSPMDNAITTRLVALSDSTASTPLSAILYVSCNGPAFELAVSTASVLDADVRGGLAVRVRVDSGSPVSENWTRSADSYGAFAPTPRHLVARMRAAHRVLIELPVDGERRDIASFSLDGLRNHLGALPCAKL